MDDFADRVQTFDPYAAGPIAIADATIEDAEPLFPSCAPGGIDKTVWFWWQPTGGQLEIMVTTDGSSYDTVITILQGNSVDTLTELYCDDDGGPGNTSEIYFPKGGADDYLIQVGRKAGTGDGDLQFKLEVSNCGDGLVELREECDTFGTFDCCDECKFRPQGASCTDLDDCTGPGGADFCDATGSCIAGPPETCEDGNPCTNDSCANGIGCRNIPHSGACEDGDPCTAGDTCNDISGVCEPGAPVLADIDEDTICDAGDNCPFVSNPSQTQSDSLPAGDACQCGDLDDDGVVSGADVVLAGQILVGSSQALGAVIERCNVVGPNDGGVSDCTVADIALIDRHASGAEAAIENVCEAYFSAP
jgi:hypothetical protein